MTRAHPPTLPPIFFFFLPASPELKFRTDETRHQSDRVAAAAAARHDADQDEDELSDLTLEIDYTQYDVPPTMGLLQPLAARRSSFSAGTGAGPATGAGAADPSPLQRHMSVGARPTAKPAVPAMVRRTSASALGADAGRPAGPVPAPAPARGLMASEDGHSAELNHELDNLLSGLLTFSHGGGDVFSADDDADASTIAAAPASP